MVKCKKCGFEFSVPFFKKFFGVKEDTCQNCKIIIQNNLNTYISKIQGFGSDNYLTTEEEAELKKIKTALELTDEDLIKADTLIQNLKLQTKMADVRKYEVKLKEVGADNYLDAEEENELIELRRSLNLTESDISHTLKDLIRLKRLTAFQNGNLPVLNTNLILQKKEICHYEIPVNLCEIRTKTKYVGGSHGVSFRITKGVYYRVGAFKGEPIQESFQEITDSGILHITNKKVVFSGTRKNVTYPLNKIVNFTAYSDAIHIQKENEAKPKYFFIDNENAVDEIGIVLNRLISEI